MRGCPVWGLGGGSPHRLGAGGLLSFLCYEEVTDVTGETNRCDCKVWMRDQGKVWEIGMADKKNSPVWNSMGAGCGGA